MTEYRIGTQGWSYADWVGPCRMLAPTIKELADDYRRRAKVGVMDADDNEETTLKLRISVIPTVIFFQGGREIHVWGPPSTTLDLRSRLTRYLSPPLFPVRIGDIESDLVLHDISPGSWHAGEFEIRAESVIHPGPTVGYRITDGSACVAYLPDHEPALGGTSWTPAWTSGHALAADADLLIHDSQYTPDEYAERIGWGHSSVDDAVAFAEAARVRRVVLFHHDPDHDDTAVDRMLQAARRASRSVEVVSASEGSTFELG